MRIIIIMVLLFSTTSFALPIQSATSVDVGNQLPSQLPVTAKGQTTKFDYPDTYIPVGTDGTANCPTGQVMVGIKVTYVGAAFTTIEGSRIKSSCHDPVTGTAWSFDPKNWSPALLTDPTRLTYHLVCRDVNVDFYP